MMIYVSFFPLQIPIYFEFLPLTRYEFINWALSNSLNTYNRHSDWHKLEVCGTNVSIYF